MLHSLSKEEYNGIKGTVLGPPSSEGRYPIAIKIKDGTKKTLKVKVENIRPWRRVGGGLLSAMTAMASGMISTQEIEAAMDLAAGGGGGGDGDGGEGGGGGGGGGSVAASLQVAVQAAATGQAEVRAFGPFPVNL